MTEKEYKEAEEKLEHQTDFTREQLNRMDEVENAVFECLKVILEDPDMEWDMRLIGPVADKIADILVANGYKVHYPSVVVIGDRATIQEYYS